MPLLLALFGLAFATATPLGLTSDTPQTRRLILQKARSHDHNPKRNRGDAPTACRHTVSGTISLRSRGTFHHSLTVLYAIGHQGIFRLTRWSWQIHTRFLGPCATWVIFPTSRKRFSYGGLTLYARPFACPSPTPTISDSPTVRQNSPENSHNPVHATPAGFIHANGLASSGFAHHYSRNHGCFLFLRVLRCFTSPRSLHTVYTFNGR
jgi:hypothetical protein